MISTGLWLFLVADRNIVDFVSKIGSLSSGILGQSNCSKLTKLPTSPWGGVRPSGKSLCGITCGMDLANWVLSWGWGKVVGGIVFIFSP